MCNNTLTTFSMASKSSGGGHTKVNLCFVTGNLRELIKNINVFTMYGLTRV